MNYDEYDMSYFDIIEYLNDMQLESLQNVSSFRCYCHSKRLEDTIIQDLDKGDYVELCMNESFL